MMFNGFIGLYVLYVGGLIVHKEAMISFHEVERYTTGSGLSELAL